MHLTGPYRFHSDGDLFYVTFSVVDGLPIFVSEAGEKDSRSLPEVVHASSFQ